MADRLRVLLVEDSEDDAALVVRALSKGGFAPSYERVDAAAGMAACLASQEWDLVLSDYSMPQFNGLAALQLLQEKGLDLPFILVSGAVGEETAVEIMRAGACDYVMKDKLARLAPAVIRGLREAESRKAAQEADRAIDALVRGMVGVTGADCFDRIIEGLCEWLGAEYGLIGALIDGEVRTLSFYRQGEKRENFSYPLAGTPCEVIVQEVYKSYPKDLRRLFPGDKALAEMGAESCVGISLRDGQQNVLGVLNIFSSRELLPTTRLAEIMGIVAVKAAAEIERLREEEERSVLEAQLRQAQKMEAIGTLAGGIAHDFNNILAAILGYTELAKQKMIPESEPDHCLGEVLKATSRAKGLVQQILAFSRKGEQEMKPMRIQCVVKEALKLLRASIPSSIEIQQRIAPDCLPILADPTRIHQIIMNLCTNASHAMEAQGGTLSVLLENTALGEEEAQAHGLPAGGYVLLVVSDTGHGMGKEVLDHIFEPYFTTKEQGKGAGMGLAIVHGLVVGGGGKIIVASTLGQGTTFRIFFPQVSDKVAEEAHPEICSPSPKGSECIFVIDDEQAIVAMEKIALERLGYRVRLFADSEEALAAFRADPQGCDLVVTDQTMPHLSGMELAKAFLQIRPDLPIILSTGYSSQASEEDALRAGIRRFIMKPLNISQLATAIREILDQR
ncbi:response regulator [Thiovibrio frasassiensis]|uniref:histidine kinase n=1 Tax=Thiovibrio frasassiensis TaxID=2984131 RepID=A0A9X4RP90_9BACT|nr:response regulator [Thiovibrio frasassiensis]MDG4474997.1 response regulator [Thiovibrio frasassiensis]